MILTYNLNYLAIFILINTLFKNHFWKWIKNALPTSVQWWHWKGHQFYWIGEKRRCASDISGILLSTRLLRHGTCVNGPYRNATFTSLSYAVNFFCWVFSGGIQNFNCHVGDRKMNFSVCWTLFHDLYNAKITYKNIFSLLLSINYVNFATIRWKFNNEYHHTHQL